MRNYITFASSHSPLGWPWCPHKKEKKNTYEIRKIRIKKMKSSNYSLVPSPPAKNKIYSDLVENSQKATLSFHFNPRFLLKPSKFQIYFAKDCKFIRFIKYISL